MKKKLLIFVFAITCTLAGALLYGCGTRAMALNKYTIKATFNESERTLECQQIVDYINNAESPLDEVVFNLYPNAFAEGVKNKPVSIINYSKAYPNGMSYGNITIHDVRVNGEACEYTVGGEDNMFLEVKLNTLLLPNKSVSISMEYTDLLPNTIHRYGFGDDTYNFGNFYPVACVYEEGFVRQPYSSNGDPFYSECADYEVTITYPNNLTLVHTGLETMTEDNEGFITAYTYANKVRDYCFVLGKHFDVKSTYVDDITINYYYFDDENSDTSLNTAVDAVNTFSDLFGDYPYNVLNVVQANFVHGGMEYPNLVYISNDVVNYDDYRNVIVHEIGHQWWYSVVGSNAYKYAWMDEGLTEFSTAMFYTRNDGYNLDYDTILANAVSSYQFFVEVYGEVYGGVDTSMDRALNEYATEPEYVYNTYVKGVLMFDSLKSTMGEKRLIKALKRYYKDNSYKIVTPVDLIKILEDSYGGISKLIDSYITGKVVIVSEK